MSYDLACFLNSRFAAIASVSGSMISTHLSGCNAQHPTPVMQIHGTADYVVSYTGTGGIVSSTDIDALVGHWVQFNNCNSTPITTNLPNTNTSDLCTATHYVYNGGTAGSTVEFYKITDGGHTWPGSNDPNQLGNANMDFSASKEIWRFFRQYSLNNLTTTGIEHSSENNSVSIYPNPSNGLFTVELNNNQNSSITVFNTLGEKIIEEKLSNSITAFDLSNIPRGVYFCQVKNEMAIRNIKLIVR